MSAATGAIALPVDLGAASGVAPGADERARRRWLLPAAVAAVLIAAALVGLRLLGVEWLVVTTPSMGRAVPVGALVIDAPVPRAALRPGDVITFVPPGPGQVAHTHRIVSVGAHGIRTRGDANGAADPWTLEDDRIRGRVVAALPGVGWLVRMLPLLLVGGLVTRGTTLLLKRPDHRAAAVLLGTSCTAAAVLALFRPLVHVVLISAASRDDGTTATVVSTGLLPVRVSSAGAHVELVDGQVGVLRWAEDAGRIDLSVAAHLPPAGWAVVVLICLLPTAVPVMRATTGRSR